MITYLLLSLSRRARVVLLALLGLFAIPSLALAVSFSDVVEMFKYTYGSEKLLFLASVETVVWNWLKRKKREITGRGKWIIPFQRRAAGVFVGGPEGQTLTTHRAQPDTGEATFDLIEFTSVWDMTWRMIINATKSKQAMQNGLDWMDRNIKFRIFRIINSQVCSFTGLGELAILPDADDQTTITVNSLPFMDEGMIVDLMDNDDNFTPIATARTVEDVDVQGRAVTISGSAPSGTAAGDYFVPAGQVQGQVSYSMFGLGSIIDTANPPAVVGNFGNVDRSAPGNRLWQGNVLGNGGILRAFTEDLLIEGENLMRQRGGVQASRYFANDSILKRYHNDLIKDKYFAYNKIQAVGAGGEKVGFGREGMDLENSESGMGGTPYTLSGKPFHCEPYLRANRILGINDDHFWIGHDGLEVPTVISEVFDGKVDFFTFTGATKFDVWGYWEAQVVSDNPQAGIQFQDIAES